jgi:hypothetical protein
MPSFQLTDQELFCRGHDGFCATAHLEGHYVVVVHAGSTAKGDGLRDDRFLKQGVVERHGDGYRFLLDFPFSTANQAVTYVLGVPKGEGRAWERLRNGSDQTLRELFRLAGWEWLI